MKYLVTLVSLSFIQGAQAETTALIANPVHKESKIPISAKSSAIGVCKHFGFETGVIGSITAKRETHLNFFDNKTSRKAKGESLILDSSGNIVTQKNSAIIETITCLNP